MEFRNQGTKKHFVGGMYRARDFVDEFPTNVAFLVAHRQTIEHGIGGLGNLEIFGHATPQRFDNAQPSELSPHALPNRQHLAQ
jgi:hypothetical protein